jgi:hypothetical protein
MKMYGGVKAGVHTLTCALDSDGVLYVPVVISSIPIEQEATKTPEPEIKGKTE